MALAPGARLGPYEISSLLGTGGMGEVYRARDAKLKRDVAIKVLPQHTAADPERRVRFEREAQSIAALNHPNIVTIYSVEEATDGVLFLTMELVDGQPLDGLIGKGGLTLARILALTIPLADAVSAAHQKGITHRDLKPANVMVTADGRVKVLDFGLAKLKEPSPVAAGVSELPTRVLTGEGRIVGTVAYMSPEQAEGKPVDHRSDIFSLGVMLHELATGERPFTGDTPLSTLTSILRDTPRSITELNAGMPRDLAVIVRRCLAKNPDERTQSAKDLRNQLEDLRRAADSGELQAATASVPRWRLSWPWAAVLVGILAVVLWLTPWPERALPPGQVVRFPVYPPEGTVFTGSSYATVQVPQFALAPDGRAIVFVAGAAGARPTLWLRSLDDMAARALPGTDDAVGPFWSPDSRWVGFFAEGKLKQVPAAGGAVQTVLESAPSPFGAAWGRDETILFSWGNNSIQGVPVAGGTVKPVTKLDASGATPEGSHRWPHALPDGRHILFTVRSGERPGIFAGSLDGVTRKFLVRADSSAVYAPPGYLLWVDGNALLGQTFDADHLELSGRPFTVAEGVGRSTASESAVSVSSTGTLAYGGVIVRHGRLTWFDRSGNPLDSIPLEGDYGDFRLSPDETRLAASLVDPRTNIPNVWLIDLAAKRPSPLTAGSFNMSAVWSPDGTRLMFRTLRSGVVEFYQKSASGGGNEEPVLSIETQRANLTQGVSNLVPSDWSRDGHVIYANPGTTSRFDVWLFRLTDNAKHVKLLGSASDEIQANFSPDGRLLAYSSNETGRFEVYVQTFPLSDRKWTASTSGGYEPRWRGDGRELYYLAADRTLMSVSITDGPSFGVPRPLFQTRVPVGVHPLRRNYVPSRDGQRFLVNTQRDDAPPAPITVVLNWIAALTK